MKIILSFVLSLICFVAYAVEPITLQIHRNQSKFAVDLPANPTTGYQWAVTSFDKKNFQLLSSHYLPSRSKRMGAGGIMRYTFKLVKGKSFPSKARISFTYARPWDSKTATLQFVNILLI